jgi:hypothetical protein
MFRKLSLAAVLAAVAFPAFADTTVKVNVAGLDAKAAHALIYRAAQEACRIELSGETSLVQFYNRPICLRAAIAKAETDYSAMQGLASR